MNCPKCSSGIVYRNQDFVAHGYYCSNKKCDVIVPCDKSCCNIKMQICPRCFGSGNWPWAQWGGPLPCSACDGAGKISREGAARISQAPVDRRNPKCPPRPGMIWNIPHQMWVDIDNRTPEQKAAHEKLAADTEARWKREGKI